VTLAGRSFIIVLLDSWGKYTRVGDATRIRQWIEFASSRAARGNSAGLRERRGMAAIEGWSDLPG